MSDTNDGDRAVRVIVLVASGVVVVGLAVAMIAKRGGSGSGDPDAGSVAGGDLRQHDHQTDEELRNRHPAAGFPGDPCRKPESTERYATHTQFDSKQKIDALVKRLIRRCHNWLGAYGSHYATVDQRADGSYDLELKFCYRYGAEMLWTPIYRYNVTKKAFAATDSATANECRLLSVGEMEPLPK